MVTKTLSLTDMEPGDEFYRTAKALLVSQGRTLAQWCEERNLYMTTVRAALRGMGTGDRGSAERHTWIRQQLIQDIQEREDDGTPTD